MPAIIPSQQYGMKCIAATLMPGAALRIVAEGIKLAPCRGVSDQDHVANTQIAMIRTEA
jgi:hypothetical protein